MLFIERRAESKDRRGNEGRDDHYSDCVHPYASREAVHEGRNEQCGER